MKIAFGQNYVCSQTKNSNTAFKSWNWFSSSKKPKTELQNAISSCKAVMLFDGGIPITPKILKEEAKAFITNRETDFVNIEAAKIRKQFNTPQVKTIPVVIESDVKKLLEKFK